MSTETTEVELVAIIRACGNGDPFREEVKKAAQHVLARIRAKAGQPTGLVFLPTMTLAAAARIAHAHGLELVVGWQEGRCKVTCRKPFTLENVPDFLKVQP